MKIYRDDKIKVHFIRLRQNTLRLAAGMNGKVNQPKLLKAPVLRSSLLRRMERWVGYGGIPLDTPPLAVGSFIITCLIMSITIYFAVGFSLDVLASERVSKEKDEIVKNVFNVHGKAIGVVTKEGKVTNLYGRTIGSVNPKGVILNVSNIVIGNVGSNGKIMNQSGTVLGSVNKNGEIFNVSGRKVGMVKEIEDINLIGGAARLLLLK